MSIGSTVIGDARQAISLVSGSNIVIDGTPVEAQFLSEYEGIPEGGTDEGYTDERRLIDLSIPVASFAGPVVHGMVVTIDDRPGEYYAVQGGSVRQLRAVDWVFTVVEADDDGT